MLEEPQPDPVPVDEPPPRPAEPLRISTTVIQLQNLAAGKADGNALVAIEEFRTMIRGLPA